MKHTDKAVFLRNRFLSPTVILVLARLLNKNIYIVIIAIFAVSILSRCNQII